jgi:hypothetical protein
MLPVSYPPQVDGFHPRKMVNNGFGCSIHPSKEKWVLPQDVRATRGSCLVARPCPFSVTEAQVDTIIDYKTGSIPDRALGESPIAATPLHRDERSVGLSAINSSPSNKEEGGISGIKFADCRRTLPPHYIGPTPWRRLRVAVTHDHGPCAAERARPFKFSFFFFFLTSKDRYV